MTSPKLLSLLPRELALLSRGIEKPQARWRWYRYPEYVIESVRPGVDRVTVPPVRIPMQGENNISPRTYRSARDQADAYEPMKYPSLPFELVKTVSSPRRNIIPDDHNLASALRFTSTWGLLLDFPERTWQNSDYQVDLSPDYRPGHDVRVIWEHRNQISLMLEAYDALRKDDSTVLKRVVDQVTEFKPLAKGAETILPIQSVMLDTMRYVDSPESALQSSTMLLPPTEWRSVQAYRILAGEWIGKATNAHSRALHPYLDCLPSAARFSENFFITYKFQDLLTVIYWHLATFFTRQGSLATCKECGNLFEQKDTRQQFCPPPQQHVEEFERGIRRRPESRCAMKNRARASREAKEKKA